MYLDLYHNNAYDSVVLFDDRGEVVGAWPNDADAIHNFFNAVGGDPANWDANGVEWTPEDGIDKLVASINSRGEISADDSRLLAERRKFWIR